MTLLSAQLSRVPNILAVVIFSSILTFAFSSMAAQPGSESQINEAIGKAYAEYGVSAAVRAGCKSSKDLGQTSWKVKRDFYVL